MPLLRITHRGAFTDAQKARLAEELTGAMLVAEAGADTPQGRAMAYVRGQHAWRGRQLPQSCDDWVLVHDIPDGHWGVSGVTVRIQETILLRAEYPNEPTISSRSSPLRSAFASPTDSLRALLAADVVRSPTGSECRPVDMPHGARAPPANPVKRRHHGWN